MNKVTKPNLYYAADLMAAVGIGAAIGTVMKKGDIAYDLSLWCSVGFVGMLAYQRYCGVVVVSNPHRLPVWVKPEDGSKPYLTADETITGADGIKVYGRVYKFRNGTHVTIDADGSFTTASLTGKFLNWLGGGELKTAPDRSWQPLFDA